MATKTATRGAKTTPRVPKTGLHRRHNLVPGGHSLRRRGQALSVRSAKLTIKLCIL